MARIVQILIAILCLLGALVPKAYSEPILSNEIYVLDQDVQAIFRIDQLTGEQTTVSSGQLLVGARGITVDSNGDILVSAEGAIIRVDPNTGAQSTISVGGYLDTPWGMAIDGLGNVLVADPGIDGVVSIDLLTGAQTAVSLAGQLADPTGVAFDINGNLFVVDEAANTFGALFEIDVITGTQTVISTGGDFFNPIGIAINALGDMFVADADALGGGGAIFQIDPLTGAQTIISSGGDFFNPWAIAFDSVGTLLVADTSAFGSPTPGAILQVNLETGNQTVVSFGGQFRGPNGIAVVTPKEVPEPGTLALLGIGLIGMGLGRRLNRQTAKRSSTTIGAVVLATASVSSHATILVDQNNDAISNPNNAFCSLQISAICGQSFQQARTNITGAGISIREFGFVPGAEVTISIFSSYGPTPAGLIASATTMTANPGWVDVFWDAAVIEANTTYFLVVESPVESLAAQESGFNAYLLGHAHLQGSLDQHSNADLAFRTYSQFVSIPEPSTFALFAICIAAMSLATRRRKV